jgi:hypothetical protein
MRWGLLAGLSIAVGAAMLACDSTSNDAPKRYFVAPDADVPDDLSGPNGSGSSGTNGAILDGGGASDAEGGSITDAALDGGSDPSTLTLTGWWHASFGGAPWLGSPSAGGSAGRDLTEVTNPPSIGAPIGGVTPAAFDGTNDRLGSTIAVSTYLSPAAWEVDGLFGADAAPAATPGAGYSSPALITDSVNGFLYVAFNSAGVVAGHYDGVSFKEIVSPCPTGGLHAFHAWYDGAKLNLVVDGNAPATPVAAGNASFGPGLLKVGTNYSNSATLNGRILELMTSAQVLGDPARKSVRAYWNRRYGTTFP